MKSTDIQTSLESLNTKLDKLLLEFEALKAVMAKKPSNKILKPKAVPLSEEEIISLKHTFTELFELWRSGKEIEVQEKLDSFDADMLRRLGDANNLNVTTRMPKQKILFLISARFREKRQLLR